MKLIYRNQSQGQKVLNIMLLIAFLALIIPYIIGVSNGNHTPWLPMISELDKSPPEGTLWSAGLSLAGLISIPVWIKLYNKWDGQLRSSNADRKYLWFNMLFVIMAQIATVSFIWTVNLPYNEYPVPHGVTAALYFYLTLLLGTIAILVVRKIDAYPKDIIKIRLALNLAGYACMILLGLSVRALSPDVCEAPCKPLFMNTGMEPDHDHIIH
ncbi:MAG: Frag1/DRAM/Sfk1 family protein, partial [Dehalococcoidia bacterium]|nr:Frag1/DRAM/Sfk1 family protein [Dehalococcoidia bacterium]